MEFARWLSDHRKRCLPTSLPCLAFIEGAGLHSKTNFIGGAGWHWKGFFIGGAEWQCKDFFIGGA